MQCKKKECIKKFSKFGKDTKGYERDKDFNFIHCEVKGCHTFVSIGIDDQRCCECGRIACKMCVCTTGLHNRTRWLCSECS